MACIDGELVAQADARVPVTDEGLLRGDGVFEVMRLYDGVPFARERHLERMAHSAHGLRLKLDVGALDSDIDALLAATKPGDVLLRVLATRGGHRIVLLEPLPPLPQALSLDYVTFAPVRVLDGIKSLSYAANMLATRIARERGYDDALLVTPHGRVLELPTASFFWVDAGELRTPPLSDHILDSITRQIVIDAAGAVEAPTTPAELELAEEAFVASSVFEVLPVSRIGDRELPAARPITTAATRDVRAYIAAAAVQSG
ncbi:MAG TPA: aminotransferase class IV [Solirubrobacteraceae bacterium]|jgi:branched-chain amino acid aminotransferase|nr:aminotransferase class IV [Solirubrobacteraceae bacterium]